MKTIILLLFCIGATGQVYRTHRYEESPEIVTIYPKKPLIFGRSAMDMVAVNIMVDSMDTDKQKAIIYAYCPQRPFGWIKIIFADETEIYLLKTKEDGNYGEYRLSVEDFISFSEAGVVGIRFDGELAEVSNRYFFCDFITNLK